MTIFMTQQYYKDKLLLEIVKEVKIFEQKFERAILQENNDFNHDTRFNKVKNIFNVCEQYRINHVIKTLKHSVQSSDLNCQEEI